MTTARRDATTTTSGVARGWLTAILAVVALSAFSVSATTLVAVASAGGVEPAWLIPVVIDVAMIGASIAMLQQGPTALARLILCASAALSVAANGVHGWENAGAGAVQHVLNASLSIAPPLLLLGLTELTARMWHIDPDAVARSDAQRGERERVAVAAMRDRERADAIEEMRAQQAVEEERLRLASATRSLAAQLKADETGTEQNGSRTDVEPAVRAAVEPRRSTASALAPQRPSRVADPDQVTELLKLVLEDGMSATRAAGVVGMPASTAKKRVAAARLARETEAA
jgi:hypothetical protein